MNNYTDAKSELTAARQYRADLESQLVGVEGKLKSLNRYDSKLVPLRAHGRDLRDEISSLESKIKGLTQVVSEAEAKRQTDIEARRPAIKAALNKLAEAINACSEAESVVESHRVSLRDAKLSSFAKLPPMVQPHARVLVERAVVELEAIR